MNDTNNAIGKIKNCLNHIGHFLRKIEIDKKNQVDLNREIIDINGYLEDLKEISTDYENRIDNLECENDDIQDTIENAISVLKGY